jgi:cation-transporting P-type ATPase E
MARSQAAPAPALTTGPSAHRSPTARSRSARTSRSYRDIVWSNTFTVFNLILGGLLVVILAFGNWRDGLFGGVIVANTLIGIVQEVRAKRTLDRLALLVAPRGRVIRDGATIELLPEDIVIGDLFTLEPGDQVVADGTVTGSRGLAVDESILTGESEPVTKHAGDTVLSGSFCVMGSGTVNVRAVGADSFAERLAAEARGTRMQLSPLQLDINRILRVTVIGMVPLAIALIISLVVRRADLVTGAHTVVAALVPLVPEGLVLLTSLTFAVAAVRLARLGALAQRINAVESLAAVDVVCVDKTGTLTDNRLSVVAFEAVDSEQDDELREIVGVFAASVGDRNATVRALRDAVPSEARVPSAEVPFASVNKWSAVSLPQVGTIVVGAPDVLARHGVILGPALQRRIDHHAQLRHRVVLVAVGDGSLGDGAVPAGLRPLGAVALGEGLRADAIDTVAYLQQHGTALKVISGDGLVTVQAVAAACGVTNADRGICGDDLPTDPAKLERCVDQTVVFARITPEQKRDLVRALTRCGRYVAMIGDGVNDVLALKEARLAIAMGSGSQIAKGVSDIVLLRGGFGTVPAAIEEGRRIIRNTHRVAKLFVTKTVYAAVLLATIGLAPIAFPFLPRHLTLTASLTIGIPAFFLALAPSTGPVRRERFIRDLLRFTVPAGIIVAAAIVAAYLAVRGPLDQSIMAGRTAAVIVATMMGLALVVGIERETRGGVRGWVWAMIGGFGLAFTIGLMLRPLRTFFAVALPTAGAWAVVAGVGLVGVVCLLAMRRFSVSKAATSAPAGS